VDYAGNDGGVINYALMLDIILNKLANNQVWPKSSAYISYYRLRKKTLKVKTIVTVLEALN
jgi:hypothetical protein